MKNFLLTNITLILLIIFSIPSVSPIFHNGFFPMHDDTQPARVYEMAKSLSYGQFPVRWVQDLGYGYGYPIFNFYAPLPYYIGGIFYLFGVGAITSTKLMLIIGVLISAVTMYFLAREIAGEIAGLTAGVLFIYAPYHAVNIYVRGAVGELYAFSFLPLIFLGILKIMKATSLKQLPVIKQGILITSIGYAFILLSHNVLGLIVSYFWAAFLIIYFISVLSKSANQKKFLLLLISLMLGFGISSFFTLPAVAEAKYTKVNMLTSAGSDFHQHFVFLDQLWNSAWGYGGSAGRESGMSFKIGPVHLSLGFISLFYAAYLYLKKKINPLYFFIFISLILLFLISVLLMLGQSRSIWEILPLFSFIQYPWRFLNFAVFSLVIASSYLFFHQKIAVQIALCLFVIAAVLWFNLKYFTPQSFFPAKDNDYVSMYNLRFRISRISDEYTPPGFIPPKTMKDTALVSMPITKDVRVLRTINDSPTDKSYDISVDKAADFLTNIAFFPGWHTYIDGQKVATGESGGRIKVSLPAGSHKLFFKFTDTPVRFTSNTISLLSLFLLLYVSLFMHNLLLWHKNKQLK